VSLGMLPSPGAVLSAAVSAGPTLPPGAGAVRFVGPATFGGEVTSGAGDGVPVSVKLGLGPLVRTPVGVVKPVPVIDPPYQLGSAEPGLPAGVGADVPITPEYGTPPLGFAGVGVRLVSIAPGMPAGAEVRPSPGPPGNSPALAPT